MKKQWFPNPIEKTHVWSHFGPNFFVQRSLNVYFGTYMQGFITHQAGNHLTLLYPHNVNYYRVARVNLLSYLTSGLLYSSNTNSIVFSVGSTGVARNQFKKCLKSVLWKQLIDIE